MAEGHGHSRAAWWTWAALSSEGLVVALSVIAFLLAVTSNTNRQEEVAFRVIEGVVVAACAAVALSFGALRGSRGNRPVSERLTIAFLFVVIPLGLFATYFVYWVFTA